MTCKGRLRPSFVLVRMELTPLSNPPRGNWKETWQQCLEIVQRCAYSDKDLVLPPMGTSGAAETFFIVASTNLENSQVMTARISQQLERVPDLKSKARLALTAASVELPDVTADESFDQQVQSLAQCISRMVLTTMERKSPQSGKSAKAVN